jgi:hypothetical protein
MNNNHSNNNFTTIFDNSSHIAKILPKNLIEPLVIIAKIKGFESIEDYVIRISKRRIRIDKRWRPESRRV